MSSAAAPDHLASAASLRHSLEEAADALARADLPGLLACEARIESALTNFSTYPLSSEASSGLAAELDLARAALVRCRRLGFALNDFVRLGLAMHGFGGGYGATAAGISPDLHTIHRRA